MAVTPYAWLISSANDARRECSPDGKTLAFIRGRPLAAAIVLESLDPSGKETEIANASRFDSLTWSPDGVSLIVSQDFGEAGNRRLRVLNTNTRDWRDLVIPPPGSRGDMRPAFSPDGRRVAFVRRRDQGSSDLFVAEIDSSLKLRGAPRQVTHRGDRIEAVQWTPDGHDLVFVAGPLINGSIWRVRADGGEPSAMLVGAGRIESVAIPRHEWKLAYSTHLSDTNIWRLRLDSTGFGCWILVKRPISSMTASIPHSN